MTPPMDWTPVTYEKNGAKRFCSPACGRDCTLADHKEAWKQARDLSRRLDCGWVPVISENNGWYWYVKKGAADLRRVGPRKYWLSVIIAGVQYQRDGITPFETIGKVWLDIKMAADKLEKAARELRPPIGKRKGAGK